MLLYTLSGFFALALEILWFRMIDVGVRSTAFTFGSVLAIYLLGLGLGCIFGGRFALHVQSPLRAFLACQTFLLLYSGAVVLLLVHLPPTTPGYAMLVDYWTGPIFSPSAATGTGRCSACCTSRFRSCCTARRRC